MFREEKLNLLKNDRHLNVTMKNPLTLLFVAVNLNCHAFEFELGKFEHVWFRS
jgi:hypothetical protein